MIFDDNFYLDPLAYM